jgi:hypothetical protein
VDLAALRVEVGLAMWTLTIARAASEKALATMNSR